MRNFTFKRQLMFVMFMLLGCLTIQATDDLITQQITVKLEKAGTLPIRIDSSEKYKITNLKIIGDINGTDLQFVREMAGKSKSGKLAILDLSEAKIVSGGDYYCVFNNNEANFYYYTEDNVLGEMAFDGCCRLTNLVLPTSITSIGKFAFDECTRLTSIVIPSSVTSIDTWAIFADCNSLTSVELPSCVTSLDGYAFSGCSSLKSIEIPFGVISIGSEAFSGCSSLKSVVIPSSVTSIGYDAFYGCGSLASIEIPSSVTSIKKGAFSGCTGLRSIYISWETPVVIERTVFEYVNVSKCTLYVPKGTYNTYRLAGVWGDFENIVEYDATGVDKVTTSTNVKEVSRYSVNGQRLAVPTRGLNIVKYSDGSVKKIAVQ